VTVCTLIVLGKLLEKILRPQQKKLHNKPWFEDESSKLIDQRKQTKLQWLQNPSQVNGDNLQTLRHE
jgi:hypothetical protein